MRGPPACYNVLMADVRGELRKSREPGAVVWAIPMCLVAIGYALFILGAYASWIDKWYYALASALLIFSIVSFLYPSAIYQGSAVFVAGLAIATTAQHFDADWMRVLYVAMAAIAARLAGWPGAVVAALMVPALEVRWYLAGDDPHLLGALFGASAAVGAIGALGPRGLHSRGLHSRGWRAQAGPIRSALGIFGSGSDEDEDAPDEPFGFMDLGGLERMDNADLREVLRAAVFALRAQSVSLFLIDGESLVLRHTSASSSSLDDTMISPVPRWFASDVARLRHTIVTGNLGAESPGSTSPDLRSPAPSQYDATPDQESEGAVSIAAAPVMEGSVMLGVLAVNSPIRDAFRGNAPTVLEIFSALVSRVMARERILAESEHDIRRMEIMNREGLKLVGSLDMAEIASRAAEAVRGIARVEVYIMVRDGDAFMMLYDNGPVGAGGAPFTLDGTLAEMAVSDMEERYFSNLRGFRQPLIPGGTQTPASSALILPLAYSEEALGLMALASGRVDALRPRQVELLKAFAGQVSMAMKNSMLHAMVIRKAITDGLTGMFNHRHFMELLNHEHARYGRTSTPFCLMLLDIDHFKRVNDTYGHQGGDEVLRGVAATIKSALRETDFIGRYGGEEFAAVLVDTLPDGAEALGERIREAVEARVFEHAGHAIRITISIGIAESLPDVTMSELIRRADTALYEAKDSGRNRVIRWQADL